MKITKYGFIKGGSCEKRLKNRYSRSVGSWAAWNAIKDNTKFISSNQGWYQIIRMPPPKDSSTFPGGIFEIGWLRMMQDVFSNLFESKKKFRLKEMKNWIEGIASMEFGVSASDPFTITGTMMLPPKPDDDAIYEKMYGIKRGLVKIK